VIHLLRNTFRYASRKYWDQIAKDIRPVYTAPTEAAAKERFVEFGDGPVAGEVFGDGGRARVVAVRV
jgi:transposase-like protein